MSEQQIWYCAHHNTGNFPVVSRVTIVKATDDFVWPAANRPRIYPIVAARRCARISRYQAYFPTWKEAKDWVVHQAQNAVDEARSVLERTERELRLFSAIPDVEPKTDVTI